MQSIFLCKILTSKNVYLLSIPSCCVHQTKLLYISSNMCASLYIHTIKKLTIFIDYTLLEMPFVYIYAISVI